MNPPRRVLLGMSGALLLAWMGCGGSGGGGGSHPPELSNFSVSPARVYQGGPGARTLVSASFDFLDAGGDVASLRFSVEDGMGTNLASLTEPIPGAQGLTRGTVLGQISISTEWVDIYTFLVTVSDQQASTSNALSGTFQVVAPPMTPLSTMPAPRYRVATAAAAGVVYLLGGGDSLGNAFTTVEAFDPATGLWSSKAAMATPRDGAVAGVIGGRIYVAAGGLSRVTEVFDPTAGTWATVAPIPTERQGAAGCELGGKLYVVGGNLGMDLATMEAYDPVLDTWTACAPIPGARSWASACALDGKLYVIGGYASALVSPWLNDVNVYDPTTDAWSQGPPIPILPGVYQHAVAAVGGQVVVFGGANAEPGLDSVYRLDPGTGTWSQGAPMPRSMSQFGAAGAGGKAYLFDVLGTFAYDPSKDLGPLN